MLYDDNKKKIAKLFIFLFFVRKFRTKINQKNIFSIFLIQNTIFNDFGMIFYKKIIKNKIKKIILAFF